MKLWILSDLHLTPHACALSPINLAAMPQADVAVVAGDVTETADLAITFLGRTIGRRMPVVAVLGNHEFYGSDYAHARAAAARAAARTGVRLLDDDETIIDNVRFAGGTLWTDYALYAAGDRNGVRNAMRAARTGMPDHKAIDVDSGLPDRIARRWAPQDAAEAHRQTVAFLERAFAEPHDGATVVVSHHGPHPCAIPDRYANDPLSPAFVSDLTGLIVRGRPKLWIHGHVHQRVDQMVADTRIICNPRGYLGEASGFSSSLVVEI